MWQVKILQNIISLIAPERTEYHRITKFGLFQKKKRKAWVMSRRVIVPGYEKVRESNFRAAIILEYRHILAVTRHLS